MPHVPHLPPASRFFARIDKFVCECPACGQVILSSFDTRDTPLRAASKARMNARLRPSDHATRFLVWNPHTQRLRCPFCQKIFVLGLLAYEPTRTHLNHPQSFEPPADTQPDRRQRLELRQASGSFWTKQMYEPGGEVNLRVTTPCSCPPKGWSVTCAVHGDPAQIAQTAQAAQAAQQAKVAPNS